MTGNSTMREAFAELAPRYEEAMDHELGAFLGVRYKDFVSRLIEAACIGEDDVVLDVATGTALIPRALVEEIRLKGGVVGLDITPAMLEQAQYRNAVAGTHSCVDLVCASGMAMPFGSGVFDVVICGFGTHHMDVAQMLSEMRRVLKVGGRLILADVALPALWRTVGWEIWLKSLLYCFQLIRRSARIQAEAGALQNMRTAGEWYVALANAGFTEIELAECQARRSWYPRALTMRAVSAGG